MIPKLFENLKISNNKNEIIYCKRCVMSNQRPRMEFNDEGVCGQCLYSEYKKKYVDWDKRERELEKLCNKFRHKDGSWDVIVPGSGGKDSSYVAYILKKKFGMNPLTVTWASFNPTEIGNQNLYNFIQSGFDTIIINPNGKIHAKISKESFQKFGENFLPFSWGQYNVPLRIAVNYKIPLIMFGENGELEYGGNLKNYNKPMLDIYDTQYVKEKFAPSSIPSSPEHWKSLKPFEKKIYERPKKNEMKKLGIQMHYCSYYENWKPEKHYEIAKKHLGFKPNKKRSEGTYTNYASLDDKTDGFHYYLMFIKFGIGRATSDAAHQIRDGVITRDKGVELVRKYDGEYPILYENEFLDFMKFDKKTLVRIIDKFRRPLIWKKYGKKWKLNKQVTKL